MARHIWSVLCEHGVVDKITNNVLLVNTMEQWPFKPPTGRIEENKEWTIIPLQGAIVSFFVRSDYDKPEEQELKVKEISPTGEVHVFDLEMAIDLKEHARSRNFIRFQGVPFWCSGTHWFIVEVRENGDGEWNEVAKIPLDLIQAQPEEDGANSSTNEQ